MTESEIYERAILDMVAQLLHEAKDSLSRIGLDAEAPSLSVDVVDEGQRTSEVVVAFLAGSNIVDVLEFHVYRSGKPVGSIRETEQWLRENLQEVLRRHGGIGAEGN